MLSLDENICMILQKCTNLQNRASFRYSAACVGPAFMKSCTSTFFADVRGGVLVRASPSPVQPSPSPAEPSPSPEEPPPSPEPTDDPPPPPPTDEPPVEEPPPPFEEPPSPPVMVVVLSPAKAPPSPATPPFPATPPSPATQPSPVTPPSPAMPAPISPSSLGPWFPHHRPPVNSHQSFLLVPQPSHSHHPNATPRPPRPSHHPKVQHAARHQVHQVRCTTQQTCCLGCEQSKHPGSIPFPVAFLRVSNATIAVSPATSIITQVEV